MYHTLTQVMNFNRLPLLSYDINWIQNFYQNFVSGFFAPFFLACLGDGSGAHGLLGAIRVKRRFSLFGIVVKQGFGIRDVFVESKLSKSEIEKTFLEKRQSKYTFPVRFSYLNQVLPYFLWVAFKNNNLEITRILQIAELLGETNWIADDGMLKNEIQKLETNKDNVLYSASDVQKVINESATWIAQTFATHWFEDDSLVDDCLKQFIGTDKTWNFNLDRLSEQILTSVIEPKRNIWCERLQLTAVWMDARSRKNKSMTDPSWQDILLLSKEIETGRPLKQIPLMRAISELSAQSALRREMEIERD